jgi:hypothetical protein
MFPYYNRGRQDLELDLYQRIVLEYAIVVLPIRRMH